MTNPIDTIKRHIDASPAQFVRRRLAESAAELSLAGSLAATCTLLNDALHSAITLLYERDTDGELANVDAATGRILIPVPWGSRGWRKWGLRAWEAEALRHILCQRWDMGKRTPLFSYDSAARIWRLNLVDYPHLAGGQFYLEREPVRITELRTAQSRYRHGRITAQSRYRQRVITAQLQRHDSST